MIMENQLLSLLQELEHRSREHAEKIQQYIIDKENFSANFQRIMEQINQIGKQAAESDNISITYMIETMKASSELFRLSIKN